MQGLAVEARINKSDLQYIIENLQQPPPPPAPPAPPTDAAADRERFIPELDGLAQERERQFRNEMTAQQNARDLAAQSVAERVSPPYTAANLHSNSAGAPATPDSYPYSATRLLGHDETVWHDDAAASPGAAAATDTKTTS